MNRHQWKAQHYGSHVNHLWLTWGEDQRRKREQERREFNRDVVFFLACMAAICLIAWGVA